MVTQVFIFFPIHFKMQQSMIAESCRIDEKQKYDQIKGNPLDFCYFHARDSTISTESSQKDELLPRLVQNLDDVSCLICII